MVTNVYQYALILAVVRCREKVNRRSKTPRCEMNLCISHGKKCFSHPGRSLAHGKKINDPSVCSLSKWNKMQQYRSAALKINRIS